MEKPTIPEVMPLIKAYYAISGNGVGGNLHIILDDGNIDNEDVKFCLDECKKSCDSEGVILCGLLLRMSKTQRRKMYKMSHT